MSVVIAMIPVDDDPVWKVSSEPRAHMTLLYLDDSILKHEEELLTFVQHIAETSLYKFGMSVHRRGTLGSDEADVLFFDKNWMSDNLRRCRAHLLTNPYINIAYNLADQFPEWTPHLTLGYPDKPAKEVDYPLNWVQFDRIAVWTTEDNGPEFYLQDEADLFYDTYHDAILEHAFGDFVKKFKESDVVRDARGQFAKKAGGAKDWFDEMADKIFGDDGREAAEKRQEIQEILEDLHKSLSGRRTPNTDVFNEKAKLDTDQVEYRDPTDPEDKIGDWVNYFKKKWQSRNDDEDNDLLKSVDEWRKKNAAHDALNHEFDESMVKRDGRGRFSKIVDLTLLEMNKSLREALDEIIDVELGIKIPDIDDPVGAPKPPGANSSKADQDRYFEDYERAAKADPEFLKRFKKWNDAYDRREKKVDELKDVQETFRFSSGGTKHAAVFDQLVDDYIEHYGVKGMKWGVRRELRKVGSANSAAVYERREKKWFAKVDDPKNLKKALRIAEKNLNRDVKALRKDYKEQGRSLKRGADARNYERDVRELMESSLRQASAQVYGNSKTRIFEVKITSDREGVKAKVVVRDTPKVSRQFDKLQRQEDRKIAKAANARAKELSKIQHADMDDEPYATFRLRQDDEGFVESVELEEIEHSIIELDEGDYLEHHGVKGMRWGYRRAVGPDGRVRGAAKKIGRAKGEKPQAKKDDKPRQSADHIRAQEALKKSLDQLSTREIKELNNRFEAAGKLQKTKNQIAEAEKPKLRKLANFLIDNAKKGATDAAARQIQKMSGDVVVKGFTQLNTDKKDDNSGKKTDKKSSPVSDSPKKEKKSKKSSTTASQRERDMAIAELVDNVYNVTTLKKKGR